MEEIITTFLYVFATLFIILHPVLVIPTFIGLTRGYDREEKTRQAGIAVAVAGGLMIIFLIIGLPIFDLLGISLSSFEVAGGLLLLIIGMQQALGIEYSPDSTGRQKNVGVLIGTPLICGPGAITTVILLSTKCGVLITLLALLLTLALTWLTLKYAEVIQQMLGETISGVLTNVFGMVLAALAITLIAEGIEGLI
ncbi:multiple antibiotic resistance protein [Methanofollis sp. W23]|uniref:MarC family protein n=1 Tax=Methanofollis sp. W23 TaxID=2817849 RepID=UPI001AE8DDB5|nr:MarC family protein [Methanofollis sp. W23]MBP2146781.1 multiple antibiotic resistance protein [Methanofollis sp. W23]